MRFLEPIPYDGMPCPVLMQEEGPWSCLNLLCQDLLTPLATNLTLFEEWVGVGGIVEGEHEEGREGKLWLFL